ncbi:MFS transporter [Sinorhizobium meliloti]|uniref:MFS transporter n=1 Tax=Rhizobium meliloti TaxID=382 RepID=UPI000FD85270|nr:MFS transporter [Sinorhizobium meliloti]RVP52920.1 MFS transporter [Sinorhizobium meliloti]
MLPRTSAFVLSRYKTFRSLWSASLISNLGSLIEGVGAAWLMTSIAASNEMVALVQSAATLPVMIFAFGAGVLADNFDRRRIMFVAQLLMLCVSAALALLTYAGTVTPWILLVLTFMIRCGWALHEPSWQASMGDIVSRENLQSAVELNNMSYNLMRCIGPAIGGLIVSTTGGAFAFLINAFCYFALIIALWRWKPEPVPKSLPREPFSSAMAAGGRYVASSQDLLKVMCRSFAFGVTAIVIQALLPLIAQDHHGGNATTYGIMLGFFGFGATCGALSHEVVRGVLRDEWVIRAAFFVLALICLFLAWSQYVWLSCLILMIAGAAWVQVWPLFNVTVQLSTPRWVVGRALSLYQAAAAGGMAAGSWIWGKLADAQGVSGALLIAGIALFFGGLIGTFRRQPDFKTPNLDPTNNFSEPVLQLQLPPRSGPILVTVDYYIDQTDVYEFLDLMMTRRRAQLRDGARGWILLRDLEESHIWTESYHVPTWVEYVRFNQRQTHADAEVVARLEVLHRGNLPPRPRHKIERQTDRDRRTPHRHLCDRPE